MIDALAARLRRQDRSLRIASFEAVRDATLAAHGVKVRPWYADPIPEAVTEAQGRASLAKMAARHGGNVVVH
jgi:hypothetical protein